MSITHIVLFQFKSDVAAEVIQDACERMIALKDSCLHSTSQQPYIKSASGGKDNSPEGIQSLHVPQIETIMFKAIRFILLSLKLLMGSLRKHKSLTSLMGVSESLSRFFELPDICYFNGK
ncbi:hypothetical protein PENNAL_c0004G05467 [Penicillium nalgiovense]|uniref:Stress-response A/B barrel domain-containing protein n=1 Tax=Penicillium nalgiovense TaxID=60175 RepID=A0A1V6Z450_PENNA|nr:hypothetical protein PENNAL_c0004G05467 [Penicillium nalgiovense]